MSNLIPINYENILGILDTRTGLTYLAYANNDDIHFEVRNKDSRVFHNTGQDAYDSIVFMMTRTFELDVNLPAENYRRWKKLIENFKKENIDGCQKCGKPEGDKSPCPFNEDVHGEKTLCNCCPDCRQQCAWDI